MKGISYERKQFLAFLLISILIHLLLLLVPVKNILSKSSVTQHEKSPIRISLLELPETKEKPEEPSRLGPVTHKAIKEGRKKSIPMEGGGITGSAVLPRNEGKEKTAPEKKGDELSIKKEKNGGKLALLPSLSPGRGKDPITSKNILDETLKEEETVDLNTTEFKYISYFSKLKTMIEMVWIYPYSSIVRGEEGTVRLRFTIESSGELNGVEILKSSGFPSLDSSAVRAIKEAAPFPPLPKSWKIKRLNVVGDFHYILGYRFVR